MLKFGMLSARTMVICASRRTSRARRAALMPASLPPITRRRIGPRRREPVAGSDNQQALAGARIGLGRASGRRRHGPRAIATERRADAVERSVHNGVVHPGPASLTLDQASLEEHPEMVTDG